MNYEVIEFIDPAPGAMVRSFHCHVCNRTHLQTGKIAVIWVNFQEGYRSQAAAACVRMK